jgi:hypothetical protein
MLAGNQRALTAARSATLHLGFDAREISCSEVALSDEELHLADIAKRKSGPAIAPCG